MIKSALTLACKRGMVRLDLDASQLCSMVLTLVGSRVCADHEGFVCGLPFIQIWKHFGAQSLLRFVVE